MYIFNCTRYVYAVTTYHPPANFEDMKQPCQLRSISSKENICSYHDWISQPQRA